MITAEFVDKLMTSMLEKEDMEIIQLAPSHSNYEKTVEAIKYIIDYEIDFKAGVVLDINTEFTRIRIRKKYEY